MTYNIFKYALAIFCFKYVNALLLLKWELDERGFLYAMFISRDPFYQERRAEKLYPLS